MSATKPAAPRRRRRTLAAAATATAITLAAVLTACGSGSSSPAHSSMPGMNNGTPAGNGLSDTANGYRMTSATTGAMAGLPTPYRFTITGPDGTPVTAFAVDQTKRLHFYAIRSDLTGFQHLHPALAADGTWTADLAALTSGTWRLFASFTPDSGKGKGKAFVLSRTLTVPGTAAATPLPKAASATTVDGYTVTVKGDLMAGMAHDLTVSVAEGGKPVTDLQPYLGTYAHLTAFHSGDQAFAHLHPQAMSMPTPMATTMGNGDHGGPDLTFHAELATAGDWRLFLQFRTAGTLHTGALTLHVS